MPPNQAQIKSSYPLPVYNYRVSIEGATIGFSEVLGLSLDYEPVIYKHGLSFAFGNKIIPGMRESIKLTLKKGVVKGGDFLAGWLQKTYANPFKNHQRDLLIDLCDESGHAVVRWKVIGALPIKLETPSFTADSNDVAIETLELIAGDLQVDYHPG